MTSSPLKIIFAGTPEFAAIALEAITLSHQQIVAVYTQPDRASGRGLKMTQSPVKELALDFNFPVYQPASLKDPHEHDILRKFNADVMVVAAYGLILPKAVLSIPRYGCLNIHASLLPRWRGAAPIQRAIIAGDKLSGITIMQMDEGLDTGDMLLKHQYALTEDETGQSLHDELARMGAQSIVEALNLLAENKFNPEKQDDSLATYAKKITKEEAQIIWDEPAEMLERKIRAFNPWPAAYTSWDGQHMKIGAASVIQSEKNLEAGTIVNASRDGIDIAAGKDILRLLKVQLPGGKMISAADFYNAHHEKVTVGNLLK
ncbi:MAG TPA: methionyl-tRNA formyltransferase [Gammaproteobacteria bacterium]|nr:methionyl-tRNA formyltransferase [Gammaproteobacteria bacterium]